MDTRSSIAKKSSNPDDIRILSNKIYELDGICLVRIDMGKKKIEVYHC